MRDGLLLKEKIVEFVDEIVIKEAKIKMWVRHLHSMSEYACYGFSVVITSDQLHMNSVIVTYPTHDFSNILGYTDQQ